MVATLYKPLEAESLWHQLNRWTHWVMGCKIAAFAAPLVTAAVLASDLALALAAGAVVLVAAICELAAIQRRIGRAPDYSHARSEVIWRELETLASRPPPPPRLRRRAARLARIGVLLCFAPAILLGGHEQDELRAAGALSLVPFVIYIFVLYSEYGERVRLVGIAHALLGAAAVLAAVGIPRLTDGNAYLTTAVTAPLLIAAVIMGERARRRWHRTDAQTEADLRAILRRRAQARAAESRRQLR